MKPASFPSRGRGWDLPGGGEKPRAAPRGRFLEHRVLAKVCTSRGRRQGWAASVAGRRHPAGQGIELQPWGSVSKKPTLLSRSGRDKKIKGSVSKAQLCFAPLQFALFCSSASPPSASRCCPQRKLAARPALGTPCGFVSVRRDKENGTGAAAQPCPALRAWPGAAGSNPFLAPVPGVKDCGEA